MKTFEEELADLLNKHSEDNALNIPDYLLAGFLNDAKNIAGKLVAARDGWFGGQTRMDETIEGDLLGFEEDLGGQIIRIRFNPPRIVPASQLRAGDKVVLTKSERRTER